ncbi:hypothetical protein [Desulfosporosinus sp. FKA]|uniref:hypothetical protein n=1 Tax=Desulfosporosinus sp. FKA TaxID=1969834 RepID=UPI000B4A1BC7|nr:hypothetical protein [Desulfosporosinus sp. FKA]
MGEKVGEKAKSEKVKRIESTFDIQIQCVQCKSRAVRILSNGQYFCADCCTQFAISEGHVTLYSISIDGGLLKIS